MSRSRTPGAFDVGSDVEVGANCAIDRGTFEATRIGEGTKIDNLVMIGHNNQIGRHNLLCGQVGIAGSCSTGDYVIMAGQAGIKDKTQIGDKVIVGAQAGVHRNIPSGQHVLGCAGDSGPRAAKTVPDDRSAARDVPPAPPLSAQLDRISPPLASELEADPAGESRTGGTETDRASDPTGF